MARKGKIKYKDVVQTKQLKQNKKKRKPTFSSKSSSSKKSFKKYKSNIKAKESEELNENESEEEMQISEDESTYLDNLLSTFNTEKNVSMRAVESESESESDSDKESSIANAEPDKEIEESELTDEIQIDVDDVEDIDHDKDPFGKHLFYEIHNSLLDSIQSIPLSVDSHVENWPILGKLFIDIPKCDKELKSAENSENILEKKLFTSAGCVPKQISSTSKLSDLYIKQSVINNFCKVNGKEFLTPLQAEIFSVLNNYQDFYFTGRTFSNSEEIRTIYCLHAVNHILKTRSKIVRHNAKISKKEDVSDEFRDQGLVRPKVLFVVPFKDSAYKIMKLLIDLILSEDKGNVINKNRFNEEYTGNELYFPKKNPKPDDFVQTFQGNIGDDFRIGITVTKKSLKLFADFYSSDIIIASPLGLRTIIGAKGEPERDYDFLASIELLILDQTEIFLMQNWDHVLHFFNHLHLQPTDSHGTDFSRVRIWSLNGWSKYYRQTLIFSSVVTPEINAIFNKKASNYAGKVRVAHIDELGTIGKVYMQVPHIFQRFNCQSTSDVIEDRFSFFINKILPQHRENMMKQTLIFIPSYFDYVKVRNYFKKEDIGFVQICEYTKDGKVARARDMFYHGDVRFLLYTERYHFFNRKHIKGVRHIVFYQLPTFPHFYYEICNFLQGSNINKNMSVSVIYSKYDIHQLSAVVGTEKAIKMLQSDRLVHMLVTGSD